MMNLVFAEPSRSKGVKSDRLNTCVLNVRRAAEFSRHDSKMRPGGLKIWPLGSFE